MTEHFDRNVESEAKKIKKQKMECSTLRLLTQKKRSTSLPDLLSHKSYQKTLYSTKVSNYGIKSNMHRKTPVQNNGESGNESSRTSDRTMSKGDQDDDHREFCAFSNYGLQQNLKTTNDGFEDNPHDKHRHRKRVETKS